MKRILSAMLILTMVFSLIPMTILPASAETYSGTCGENLTWKLDTGTGELTISGTGAMYDYDFSYYGHTPWYNWCALIGTVTIQHGVTSIGNCAFYNCTGPTSITIPDSVTSIGNYAFEDCSGLTSITIPSSVTSIGDGAFYDCSSLTSVMIPDGVTSIGYDTFYNCNGLTSITIPDAVTSIGDCAFKYCSGLTSITIPDSVTSIGRNAFNGCSGLTSITIPSSVTSINYEYSMEGELAGCTALTSIVVDENNTVYDSRDNCNAIIETASNTMIAGCATTVIPDSVTSIGDFAFEGCSGLTSVTIPDSVTSIGFAPFVGCTALTAVNVSDIGAWCGISFAGDYANPIQWAHNLYLNGALVTDLVIPCSVTSISDYAFYGCTCLTSVAIPDSVTSIGYGTFYNCNGLTSITIPNSVTSIGDYAFSWCEELTSITIPDSVTGIGDYAFRYCSGLTSIVVEANNAVYDSRDNCNAIIETESNTLIYGCANTVIPDSITSIGGDAFYGNTCLTSVAIPDSVTSIGYGTFYNCTGLTSVTIPDAVTWIGNNAFGYCTGLKSITIPSSVTSIGYGTFNNCTGLTSITIPNSVTSIGEYAFRNCSGLTDVYFIGSEAEWNSINIYYSNTDLTNATIHYLAEGLKIDSASLTLYEDIVVNFTATVPEGLTEPYMVIELGEQSYTVQPSREDSQGRLVFEFMNLTPDMMGDNIKATLYATAAGGQLVHFCKPEYSVKQYCTNVMAAYPENAKLQTLLADILVYGAATQRFTGHNDENLVTEGLTLAAASAFENLTTTVANTPAGEGGIRWLGAGLICGSRMSMYFDLTTDAGENTTVEVTINGRKTTYAYADIVTEDATRCRVIFRGVSACEYGDVVTAVIKNDGEPVGDALTYSVNSYVYSKQNDTNTANLAQLVQAIYKYGKSAKEYLNR